MSAEAGDTAQKSALPHQGRSSARLSSVQALYQVELSHQPVETVIREFTNHRLGREIDGANLAEPDREHFARTVRGAAERAHELDGLIAEILADQWTLDRLGALMRALMRAAACELLTFPDVPARVVIDEYVDIARAFYSDREPAFVNGALDKLARRLRPNELELAAVQPRSDARSTTGG